MVLITLLISKMRIVSLNFVLLLLKQVPAKASDALTEPRSYRLVILHYVQLLSHLPSVRRPTDPSFTRFHWLDYDELPAESAIAVVLAWPKFLFSPCLPFCGPIISLCQL